LAAAIAGLQALESQVLGLDAAATARFESAAWLAYGDVDAAMRAGRQAVDLATRFSSDPERWFALQAQARAESVAGEHAVALTAFRRVRDGLLAAGFSADSLEQQRARRHESEALARAGDLGAAESQLRGLVVAAPAGARLERGQTLDDLGSLLASSG